jgi:hypothetical protein
LTGTSEDLERGHKITTTPQLRRKRDTSNFRCVSAFRSQKRPGENSENPLLGGKSLSLLIITMTEVNRLFKSSGDGSSQRYNASASAFGKDMDAFDDFLGGIVEEPTANSSSSPRKHLGAAIQVVDSDEESLFSCDSDDEFGSEECKPQYHQTDGALEQMFSKGPTTPVTPPKAGEGRPRSMRKVDDLSKSEHSSGRRRSAKDNLPGSGHGRSRSAKDELSSTSSDGGDRSTKDELTCSSYGRRRSAKDDLGSSSHGGQGRTTKDELSSSSRGRRQRSSKTEEASPRKSLSPLPPPSRRSSSGLKKDDLSRSEHSKPRFRDDLGSSSHGGQGRTTKDELSSSSHGRRRRSSKTEEASPRKSLSPLPPTSRRSSSGPKKDDLSRSDHSKPRFRRNDLYSKTNHVGKNETRRSRKLISTTDFELYAEGAKKLQERRARYERARRDKSERQSASGGTTRCVESSPNDLSQSCHVPRRTRGSLSEISSSDPRPRSTSRETPSRGRKSDVSPSDHRGSGELSRAGSSVDTKGLEGMYTANRAAGASGMRRSQSSADAHSLSRNSRPSQRGSKTGIDGLAMNLKRESKINALSKMNATWDV